MLFEVNDGICTYTFTGHILGFLLAQSTFFLLREGCNEEKSKVFDLGLHSMRVEFMHPGERQQHSPGRNAIMPNMIIELEKKIFPIKPLPYLLLKSS